MQSWVKQFSYMRIMARLTVSHGVGLFGIIKGFLTIGLFILFVHAGVVIFSEEPTISVNGVEIENKY